MGSKLGVGGMVAVGGEGNGHGNGESEGKSRCGDPFASLRMTEYDQTWVALRMTGKEGAGIRSLRSG